MTTCTSLLEPRTTAGDHKTPVARRDERASCPHESGGMPTSVALLEVRVTLHGPTGRERFPRESRFSSRESRFMPP